MRVSKKNVDPLWYTRTHHCNAYPTFLVSPPSPPPTSTGSTSECDLVHGECVQNYVPYLFLVIPLGPVTLTGQDYVLVESGCTCRPKYARQRDPDPLSVIPEF